MVMYVDNMYIYNIYYIFVVVIQIRHIIAVEYNF